jgi:hypothetical protein
MSTAEIRQAPRPDVRAPFTPVQQQALYDWQNNPRVHPFTCINGHGALAVGPHWYCTECDYTQYWAHYFMAQPQ